MPQNPRSLRTRVASLARREQVGGIGLVVGALGALAWANGWGGSYAGIWTHVAPWSRPLGLDLTARGWVNQALLLVFFAAIGLEVRRELTTGALRSFRLAVVPVVAALVGMAVPALLYTAVVAGGPGARGWGVPMATDVAFALGALALGASRASGGRARARARARVFLLSLAVTDDLASIAVLVALYRQGVEPAWIVAGVAALVLCILVWAARVPGRWGTGLRLALLVICWWSCLHAGVEAAVVGVALGIVGPRRALRQAPLADAGVGRWEEQLAPWVNLVVLPAFALANAGVRLEVATFSSAPALRVFLAVLLARVLGKPLGIVAGALLARRTFPDTRRQPLERRALLGVGAVAGIGFTVPLLIISATLPSGPLATAATCGLLASSIPAVLVGAAL